MPSHSSGDFQAQSRGECRAEKREDYGASGAELPAPAASAVQIKELLCIGEVPDNIELADRFSFGCRAGGSRCAKIGAFVGFFCPLAVANQELQGLGIFDKDIH